MVKYNREGTVPEHSCRGRFRVMEMADHSDAGVGLRMHRQVA